MCFLESEVVVFGGGGGGGGDISLGGGLRGEFHCFSIWGEKW